MLGFDVIKSDERAKIQELCGWTRLADKSIVGDPSVIRVCKQMSDQGEHLRACVVAALHFDFNTAMSFINFSKPDETLGEDTPAIAAAITMLRQMEAAV